MRLQRRTMVVWSSSSSSGRAARPGARGRTRSTRRGRIRWWLRTGALLMIIAVMRMARTAVKYPRPALSLAGMAITVAAISLPSKAVLIAGFLVLAVALFLPDPASAPARPCSARLWAMPLTPSRRSLPPPD